MLLSRELLCQQKSWARALQVGYTVTPKQCAQESRDEHTERSVQQLVRVKDGQVGGRAEGALRMHEVSCLLNNIIE
jgi:hypothetical protein